MEEKATVLSLVGFKEEWAKMDPTTSSGCLLSLLSLGIAFKHKDMVLSLEKGLKETRECCQRQVSMVVSAVYLQKGELQKRGYNCIGTCLVDAAFVSFCY